MDIDTNIEILNESDITVKDLQEAIKEYLNDNPSINSVHRLCFEEIKDYLDSVIKGDRQG